MKRILTATVLILAVFALIFFGQLWMIPLFSAIVAELAAYEYLKLAAVGAEAHGATLRIPVWWMALGTMLAFVVQVVTGVALAFSYVSSSSQASRNVLMPDSAVRPASCSTHSSGVPRRKPPASPKLPLTL